MSTELLDAVHALTRPTTNKIIQDTTDGGTKFVAVTQPALLAQLTTAIMSSMGASSGSALKSEGSILNTAALFEAMKISTLIRDWCRIVKVPVTNEPTTDLDRWYVAVNVNPMRPESVKWYTDKMAGWANRIRGMLDPPRERELDDPCPVCGADTFWKGGNEYKRALVIRYRLEEEETILENATAMCRSCEQAWPAKGLSAALGHDTEEIIRHARALHVA